MKNLNHIIKESVSDDFYLELSEDYIAGDKIKKKFINKFLYDKAKENGFNVFGWHGVHTGLIRYHADKDAKNFTEFETVRKSINFKTREESEYISGSWFSNNPKYVRSIGMREEPRRFLLRIENPLDARVLGRSPTPRQLKSFYKKHGLNVNLGHGYEDEDKEYVIMHDEPYYTTNEAVIKAGFDAFILYEDESTSFVVYKPEQIKLFDITFDDSGNIIPLRERFDFNNPDFRY